MNITITSSDLCTMSFDDVARALGAHRLIDTDRTGVTAPPTSEVDTVAATVRGRVPDTAPVHVDGPGVVLISAPGNPLI